MAAQSVVFTQRTVPVSKTELLMEVVYRVITGLPHTPEYKKKFMIYRNKNLLIYTNVLVFTCIKIFVYT